MPPISVDGHGRSCTPWICDLTNVADPNKLSLSQSKVAMSQKKLFKLNSVLFCSVLFCSVLFCCALVSLMCSGSLIVVRTGADQHFELRFNTMSSRPEGPMEVPTQDELWNCLACCCLQYNCYTSGLKVSAQLCGGCCAQLIREKGFALQ